MKKNLPPISPPEGQSTEEDSPFSSSTRAEPILLAVTGMSPSVLTETIWALANQPEPIIPSRVIAVTTTTGRDSIKHHLFTPLSRFSGQTAWDTLRHALEEKGFDITGRLRFGTTADDIRVITAHDLVSGQSVELADLRSPSDSAATADYLLEQVRAVVENPDTELIASIAGGRKTMGALLYACMTLAGRETDRLTHVLVSEPFETLREFYFPTQPGGDLLDRDGLAHCPSNALIELAEVTFVPLRNLFTRELGQPAGTFRRLVENCRSNLRRTTGDNLQVEIERTRPHTQINGRLLELAPREHLVLLFFAIRAKQAETIVAAYDEVIADLEQFRKEIRQTAPPQDWGDWRHASGLDRSFDSRELIRILSDLRRKAKRAGGDAAFLASVLPERGRCSLDIPGPLIHIKG